MKKSLFLIPLLFLIGCKTIDDPNVSKRTTLRVYNSDGKLLFAMPASDKPFVISLNGDISITLPKDETEKRIEEEANKAKTDSESK